MTARRMLGPGEISIRDPWILESFQLEQKYLLSLEPDRLLAGFRETAGLKPEGVLYGGWESTEIRGHTLGHYLTAMAQAWAVCQEERFLVKLEETVSGLTACQRPDGFLFASPESLFDRVERREPVWVPWYTMHKLVAGLISVWDLTPVFQAGQVACRLADWIANRVLSWSEETRKTVLVVEYGGMNDCLYDMYARTGTIKYLLAARRFEEKPLFDAMLAGEDKLNGLHANTTIPKILGGLKRYAVTGEQEEAYLQMAENFWEMVVDHHTYVTGGNSEWEHFGLPDVLDAERTACNCETCNTYNMLKLSQLLFQLTGKKKYADYDAWAYVNTILSSQNHETGMTTYFQPMATGYFKVYSRPYDQFWCCTGTGMENFTKPWAGAAYEEGNTLYLSRLISMDIFWRAVALRLRTDWVNSDWMQLHALRELRGKTIAVRRPHWAGNVTVQLPDGVTYREAEGFLLLEGNWPEGAGGAIRFSKNLNTHGLPDNRMVTAYSYGPFLLSADLGREDLQTTVTGVDVTVPKGDLSVRDYLLCPELRHRGGNRFVLQSADGWSGELAPHFLKQDQRYGIYFPIFSENSRELADFLAEKKRKQKAMDQYDVIPLGNDQYELSHGIRGEKTDPFADGLRRGREIQPGGVLSYQISLPQGQSRLCLHAVGTYELLLEEQTLSPGETIPLFAEEAGTARLTIRNPSQDCILRLYDELIVIESRDK